MTARRTRVAVFILLCIILSTILTSSTLRGKEADVPHGQRDWSNIGASEVVHGTADLAELAARLGSPNVFNREGNVLRVETFEHGATAWGTTDAGTNASIRVSAAAYRTGGYSLELNSGTGILHYALAWHTFPYPSLGKVGVELSFSFDSNVTLIDPEFWIYDGDRLYVYGLRYDTENDLIRKRTGDTTWETIIEDVELHPSTRIWNVLKVVVDPTTGYYCRLIINEQEYDISDEQSYSGAIETNARMNFRFTVRGSSNTAGIAYLDDLIVTRGEP